MARSLRDKNRQEGVGQGAAIWVVEMLLDKDIGRWVPTVGVALIRNEAEPILEEWRKRNPDDRFRLKRYCRIAGKEEQLHE